MHIKNLHLLPLAVFVLFPSTFITVYVTAVLLGHVEPDFPYVSDAGTLPPESCLFGQLLNVGAALLALVCIVRYYQVEEYRRQIELRLAGIRLNKYGLVLGLITSLAISMVANFQVGNFQSVHVFAAAISFCGGTIYCWMQAFLSLYMYPMAHSKSIAYLRLGISVLCLVSCIISGTTGVIAYVRYRDKTATDRKKWFTKTKSKIGWELHIVSAVFEWVMGLFFSLFMLTFVPEFRRLNVEMPSVVFKTLDIPTVQTRPTVT